MFDNCLYRNINFHPQNWKIDIYMRYILYSAIKDRVRKVLNFIIVQMNSLKIYHTVKALNFHVIHNQQQSLKNIYKYPKTHS